MWRAAAGRRLLLICQKLGGQSPTLPTRQSRPGPDSNWRFFLWPQHLNWNHSTFLKQKSTGHWILSRKEIFAVFQSHCKAYLNGPNYFLVSKICMILLYFVNIHKRPFYNFTGILTRKPLEESPKFRYRLISHPYQQHWNGSFLCCLPKIYNERMDRDSCYTM